MKRVRISDIAAKARVSNATVSYALSDSGRVSRETRDRIIKIADAMGFIRDDVAAQLRTGRSSLIGVILNTIVNPFFSELVASLEVAAYEAGYLTLLATAQNDPVRQSQLMSSMVARGVAGVIVSPVHETSADLVDATVQLGIPTVVCVRDIPGSKGVFVGADEKKAGYLAARHLVECGHTAFKFIGGFEQTTTWQSRRDGMAKALSEFGIAPDRMDIEPGALLPEFAYRSLTKSHQDGSLPGAVICFNDDQASGAYQAARDMGLQVGKDISVVGFDNIPQSKTLTPELTTVDIYPSSIGRISAELIREMLVDSRRRVEPVVLEPSLVSRGSVVRVA